MGCHGARFEFRMELTTQKPGMITDFDDLHQFTVRRSPAVVAASAQSEDGGEDHQKNKGPCYRTSHKIPPWLESRAGRSGQTLSACH